jgi:hypothetical protein
MKIHLTEVIKKYLEIETNYAVIIDGQYGVGKTYFYKNILRKEIKEISLPKDNNKKYEPIYISLFGYKSIEEIQTAVFLELYPILKTKGVKLGAGIAKSIIRGIATVKNIGNVDDYINDLAPNSKDWLNFDELVICFDDIDRKSESLRIEELFGFISLLVENQGAKVILIANNEKLKKDKDFHDSFEKIISTSVKYYPDIPMAYNSIIEKRYKSGNTTYYNYLEKNNDEIISATKVNNGNFRSLIFF